jgi:hypothetical protein
MTFIGPLMMYNNFSVTVYGALDHVHVHVFSDFRLVNHKCILNDSIEGQARLLGLP